MFAELQCKTNFSFLQGGSHPQELVQRAADIDLAALAITDDNGVYGIPKAYWEAKHKPNFNLISGCTLTLHHHAPITLLAKTRRGYGLMCKLLTAAHADKEKGQAHLTLPELGAFLEPSAAQDLIALLPLEANHAFFQPYLEKRLYLTLARFKDGFDQDRTDRARALSKQYEIPVVATNDVLYHGPDRRRLHDALTCIKHGTTLPEAGFKLRPNAERYLKSPFEMKLLFRDFPEAVSNTLIVAEQCTFSPAELRYRYPSEWIPSEYTAQSYLEKLTIDGAKLRYPDGIPDNVMAQVRHEFSLIAQLQFADYFLTIHDIVEFAKRRKILCQGRGSAANSSVCYCLGITAIDPVLMELLFERFISVERGEPPDIDVDFEHERREEVIQYIYEKYGRDRAAMVSAVITYQKRSVFRELAKVFGVPVGTLSAKKMEQAWPKLVAQSPIPDAATLIDEISNDLETFPRHLSIHSGGFTLSADPITEIVPVEPARMEGRTIVQWDKYDLDYLGLLKVDILALGMLSAVRKSLDHVGIAFHEVPKEDRATYEMIQRADTVGTFQVESRAQMNMSGRLLPKKFYDLVVQIAIVRPGPIEGNMVHPYLKRRRGLEPEVYPHPKLKEILGRTMGVPLFQEQLMKIAIELGNFTPGESDHLRRAIGAWRASGSIRAAAQKLFERLMAKGIPESYAHSILEQMKGFAHYGFPESHAASFALVTYVSCWLKCHHPAAFTCGLLNSQPMGFYQPHSLIDDAKRHGVTVLPIDPNHSQWDCTIEDKALRLGLRLVSGLHQQEAERILAHRPFTTLQQFIAQTRLRAELLERLAMAGAFAPFQENERTTLWNILAHKLHETQTQLDLFRNYRPQDQTEPSKPCASFAPISEFERIQYQYNAYNVATAGHPMQALRKTYRLSRSTTQDARSVPHKSHLKISGLLLIRQRPPTANGVTFGAIEDEFGILDIVLFQQDYERLKSIFLSQCFLTLTGQIERDNHAISMIVKDLKPIFEVSDNQAERLTIEPVQYFI